MSKLILIIGYLSICQAGFSQKLPTDIKLRIEELKSEAQLGLNDFRIDSKGMIYIKLKHEFSDEQQKRIANMKLKIHIGLIYDKSMRARILQLLRNEYKQQELDTLVNRHMKFAIDTYMQQAIDLCKFDTLSIYKNTYDSIVSSQIKSRVSQKHLYDKTVFITLRLDTTKCYNNVINKAKESISNQYQNEDNNDLTIIAELAGHLGDKEFVQLLIAALDNPNFQRNKVIEALVRMKVEPYYSNFIKSHTLTLEQIKSGSKVDIDVLSSILRSQQSFLELSKYLFSEEPYIYEISEIGTVVGQYYYQRAYELIVDNIENKDLQQLVKGIYPFESKEIRQQLYQWMQNNYRKYLIKADY